MLYATDASIYQMEPIGVVEPKSPLDAVRVVQYCGDHGLAILPRGGGTALAGQTVNRAVVIDFSRWCRGIGAVDVARQRVHVEPGVVLDQLNQTLVPFGLMFGPDVATASHACLGGMIGNNSAGAYSILYGRTVEHLEAVDVVLSTGKRLHLFEGAADSNPDVAMITRQVASVVRPLSDEIRRRFPKIKRHVDGYNLDLMLEQLERSTPGTFDRVNLAHLVCGSEGTLATTLGATLRLVDRPKTRGLAIVGYASVAEALSTLSTILSTEPAAVELVDDVVIEVAKANSEYRHYVELMPQPTTGSLGAVLYVEYFGQEPASISASFARLRSVLSSRPMELHTDPQAMARAWKLRKAGEPLLHGIPGLRKPVTFVEDTAVDPARLPDFVDEFRQIVTRYGTTAAYYAHASVGCLHIRPMIHLKDPGDLAVMQRLASDVAALVSRYDGALSGEHGDGRVRSPFLEQYFGPRICEAFRAIKRLFDPQGLMNPGNITAPTAMVDHLRVKPHEDMVTVPFERTYFNYEREHGFESAIEMCNGAGLCRRVYTGGVMCPSYRALRDERHATRGRGNALRLAVTGQLGNGSDRWSDPETLKTLDLCLSCKACKSECPSNVDIAKLKAEYLAHHYQSLGRTPFSSLFFGHVRELNRLGALTPGLANFVNRLPLTKWILERTLGIDSRRSVPEFSPSLWSTLRRRGGQRATSGPVVLFLADCFTTYNESGIGLAAVNLLERCGYRVIIPDVGCCGRALISNGALPEAIRTIRATAQRLMDAVASHQAIAVVGCEPSCVSAIKDDWLDLSLRLDSSGLKSLAAKTHLCEEFIHARWNDHPKRLEFTRFKEPVLLHGHCHQKALWGVESSAGALRRVCESLNVLDSGCCGMAGSFGFDRTRYELSLRIGEQSLFGPVREHQTATIVAPGTSCRHQLRDALGRHAIHPVELLTRCLADSSVAAKHRGD